jgi:hypothetical protein
LWSWTIAFNPSFETIERTYLDVDIGRELPQLAVCIRNRMFIDTNLSNM